MKRRVSPLPALTPRLAQFVLAAFAPFALAAAAWIPPAHAAPFAQLMPRVAPDGQGGSYSAWIGDNGADHIVYAQHYTASGLVAPGWPAAGAVISSPAGVFDDVSIVADGAGGAFIAWDKGDYYGEIGLRHVSAAGPASAVAPLDPPDGTSPLSMGSRLAPGPQPQKFDRGDAIPALAPDGAGGVFMVWQNSSQMFGNTVLIRHYAAGGVSDWSNAVPVTGSWVITDPVVTADGSGGAYVVWSDQYPTHFVAINHLTSAGAYAPGWALYGLHVCDNPGSQAAPSVVTDGAGGAIVAWADSRDPTHDQVFAQRVSADGQLGWGASGVSVCSQPSLYGPNRFGWFAGAGGRRGELAPDGAGGALLAWADQRHGASEGLADAYAQRIGADGAPAPGWPADGVAICAEPGDQLLPAIAADGAGGAYVAWQDHRPGAGDGVLRFHRIDGAGRLSYGEPADGAVISATPVPNWPPALSAVEDHAALSAWVEAGDPASVVEVSRLSAAGSAPSGLVTSLAIASDRNPAREGRTITLTATVEPASATGSVEFQSYGRSLASVPLAGGVAQLIVPPAVVGPRTFVATYSGDPTYAPSSGYIAQRTIARIPATITLATSENPTLRGRTVRLRAAIPQAASGTVEFGYAGHAALGTVPVVDGVAALEFAAPEAGLYGLRATYSGDTAYTAAHDSLLETVYVKFPTQVGVRASSNPSTVRDVQVVATVTPATLSGSIVFADDDGALATVPLVDGVATLPYHSPRFGTRDIIATYAGAADYGASDGVLREIFVGTATTITLESSANPASVNLPFTVTARVQPQSATGVLKFSNADSPLGVAPIVNGVATMTCLFTAISEPNIIATYPGDTTFSSSMQNLLLDVLGNATVTTLVSSASTIMSGSRVRFTATVTPPVEGAIEFWIDGRSVATVPLANGRASLTTSTLADGDHSVMANFPGGALIRPSSSNALIERVITPTTPFARVLSPNDGETWHVGSAALIQWDASSSALAPRVWIFLARTPDLDWQPIAVDVPNIGSYTWTVTGPGTNVGSTEVMSAFVMVADQNGRVGSDQSDLPFSIIDAVTAAIVTRLDAETADFGIRVTWALSGGAEFATVELQRAPAESGPWLAVAASRRDESGVTIAEDRTAEPGSTYWYRLVGTTSAGTTSVFGPVKGSAGAPREFGLSAAWPNPSRGPVACEFTVAQPAQVRLDILDLQGRERSVLAQGNYAPGRYRVQWDGAEAGVSLPAGVYFVRYAARGRTYVSRVALVR